MPKIFIHTFRISGMYDSADVAAVRSKLIKIPGVSAVNVDLRKMQVDLAAPRLIEAPTLRNALGNVDFGLSGLTTSIMMTPSGVRDDAMEEPKKR